MMTLRFDRVNSAFLLFVDDRLVIKWVQFARDSGVDPEFLAYVADSIRFYPLGAEYLGRILNAILREGFSFFHDYRKYLLIEKEIPAEDIVITIDGLEDSSAFPFELLLDETGRSFLIHQHPFYRRIISPPTTRAPETQTDFDPDRLQVLIIKSTASGELVIAEEEGQITDISLEELQGVEEEVEFLRKLFPKAVILPQKKHSVPTIAEIRECLLRQRWDIVHFAGHGIYRGGEVSGILLSGTGDRHDLFLASTQDIDFLFRDSAGIKFVYLNACESVASSANAVIRGALPGSVLAFRWLTPDAMACVMAKSFYWALLNQRNPEYALLQARRKMYYEYPKDNTWASAVLFKPMI
jgi:hypothetical protein